MFPKSQNYPPCSGQLPGYQTISLSIALNFLNPIFTVSFECGLAFTAPSIAMPEFTIAKNGDTKADENKVRLSQDGILFAVPESGPPKRRCQPPFNYGAAGADAGHREMDLLRRLFQGPNYLAIVSPVSSDGDSTGTSSPISERRCLTRLSNLRA
jgi:hypothetical protein